MRIHFFIAITLLCYLQSNAQGQYFEQALKEGRSRGRTYTMVNTKGKWIGMKNVKKYAESHDLLLGSYKYELVNRFGEPDEKITSIEFLPRYEYPQFIFEQIFPKSSFTSLKTKGKAILPNKLSDESVFALYDNVLWSGEVDINGYISGFGSGFFEDGMLYRYFSGFFVNGQPQGDIDFLDYSHHGSLKFYPKNIVTAMLFSDPNKNDSQLVINSSQNTSSNAYSTSNDSYIKDPVKDLAIVLIGTGLITYGIIKLANAVGFDSNYGVTYSSNRSSYSSKKAKEDGDNEEKADKNRESSEKDDNSEHEDRNNEKMSNTPAYHCTVKIMKRGSSGNEWPVSCASVTGESRATFGGMIKGRTDEKGICTLEWERNTDIKKIFVSCGLSSGYFPHYNQSFEGSFQNGGFYTLYLDE